MSGDSRVLAEMDCFHRYYRFCLADDESGQSRFEAWLDYKQAILRRDDHRCCVCGQVRPVAELEVRPRQLIVHAPKDQKSVDGAEQLTPDNLACVCAFCDDSTEMAGRLQRQACRPG